jgi:nucleoside-diphosphate-sugar epimerase
MKDLGWKPQVTMADALKHIYEAYRGQVAEARKLVE